MQAVTVVPQVQRRAAIWLSLTGDIAVDLKTRSSVVNAARVNGMEITKLIEVKGNAQAARAETVLAATSGKVDVLVMNALADIGVSTALEILAVGARLVSVREPWLNLDADVNLLVSVFSWAVTEERARKARTMKAGQVRARLRAPSGKVGGRPRKVLAPHQIQQALSRIAEGASIAKAAQGLGCSRSHLKRALSAHEALTIPTAVSGSPLVQQVTHYAEAVCKEVG